MIETKFKTSHEWQSLFPTTKVLDPDGWDRTNFNYSWYIESISKEEYDNRVLRSTAAIIPSFNQA